MMLLKLNSITKYIGAREILKDINFTVSKGQRVGLLGLNGSGKSTLFKLIEGEILPDRGEFIKSDKVRTGYLPQGFCDFHQQKKLSVCDFLLQPARKYLNRMEELEKKMETKERAGEKEIEDILAEYGYITEKFEQIGGYLYEERLEEIFKKIHIDKNISPSSKMNFLSLSGGQKLKMALARILAGEPDLLLLDEPTNYLDIPSLIWLENFLSIFKGGTIVISHDRKFLDKFAEQILELSILDGTMKSYTGNYSSYRAQKKKEREKHWQSYKDQQEKISRLKDDIGNTRNYALKTEKSTTNDQLRRYAKKVAKKAKSREKRLERELEDKKRIDKPWALETVRINLKSDIKKGKALLTASDLCFTLPDGRKLLKKIDLKVSGEDKIAIMGPNGSGKSTLMKILAEKIKPCGGKVIKWDGTDTGYLPQDEGEELNLNRTVFEEFRSHISMEEGEARTYLHRMLFKGNDVFKQVKNLSYGERIKLIMAGLMASGKNVLLLDEPTGHLDIDTIERLEKALAEFKGGLVVISHDRYFIEKINIKKIYILERGEFSPYNSYNDYEKNLKIFQS